MIAKKLMLAPTATLHPRDLPEAPITAEDIRIWARVERALAGRDIDLPRNARKRA